MQNCIDCLNPLLLMQFFTETYHKIVSFAPKSKAKLSLGWESQRISDRRYQGCCRIDLRQGEIPPYRYISGDGLKPVGVYVVVRGRSIPDGIYAYDRTCGKGALPSVGQLVRLGGKGEFHKLWAAFPDREFVEKTPLLYIFTGVMERSVWRFGESAYPQVLQDVGACATSVLLHAKSRGGKVFALGGFVDDMVAVTLNLPATELPMAALAVFPEYSETAFNSVDEGVGETAYSNRAELDPMTGVESFDNSKYPSLFMHQNRVENIEDLSKCVRIRRLSTQAFPGDEFPLTPAKFNAEIYFKSITSLEEVPQRNVPFKKGGMDLDDFSSLLRWLEMAQINLFGAGLLKFWIVSFDVMFVYPGVYRYVPVRKSLYMQSGAVLPKKFIKCHGVPESADSAAFALVLTADLNEACSLLGERAYRYLNLNVGALVQSLHLSSRLIGKCVRSEHFYYQEELKKICSIPETESVLGEILVGKV